MTRSRQRAARREPNRRPRRPSTPEPVWSLPAGARLLSLDVFGAALDRLVLAPADVHGLVAGELAAAGTPVPPDYPDLRLTAERMAWRRARRAGRAFIGLADIADELVALLPVGAGPDRQTLGRLAIGREVALERRLSRPNPEALAAVHEARRQRVPVAFVADTYLPRDLVAALLRGAGLPAELVLVSSHEGATKDGGELFRHLAERAGVGLDRIVHLGPDPAVDVAGPARLGIDARRFVPAHRSVAAGLAHGVDEPSALDSVALALAARRLGALPAEAQRGADGPLAQAVAPEIGYGVAGPLAVGFAAWVGAQIDDQQPDLVLFADAAAHRTPALVHELRPDLPANRLRPLPVVSADCVSRLVDGELGAVGHPDPRVLVVGLGWPDQEHRHVDRVLTGAGARSATVGGAYLGLAEPAGPRERVDAWAFDGGPSTEPAAVASDGARQLLASLVAPPADCDEMGQGISDFARDLAPWLNDGGASLTAALAAPALQLVERQALDQAASGPDSPAPAGPPSPTAERRSRVPGRHR